MNLLLVPLTIGLPAIDESLDKLLVAMETFPNVAVLGDAIGLARILGLLLALCVGSYECWMMMLGRRGMDVMKLLRIIGISICISSSSWICQALQVPGKGLETATKAMAKAKNKEVAAFELKVAQKQSEYLDHLREVQDSISTAQQVAAIGQDAAWWDKLIYNVENLGNTINNYAQRAAVAAETKMSEWINDVIRFVGELIFQMSYYGILVAQRIFMAILMIFCPIMFALSLAPPWNSAWSQWMSKFLSLSLWGFVTYMCIYYIDFILLYNLQQDLIAYNHLLHGSVNSWEQIGALGLQGIGSNCMYAMGMLVGAYIIRFVPEVASWLIPGGVSSGAGSAAGFTDHRSGFSRNRTFIDGGQTFYDFTVCRNDIPCFTLKDIAFLQLGTAYRLQLSTCDPLGRCFLTSFAQAVSLSLAPCFGNGFRKVGKKQGQKKNDENAEVIDYRALCIAHR